MKHTLVTTLYLTFLMLSACSMNPHSMGVDLKVQHDALANHYEEAAKEMRVKADEHKRLLSQYSSKSYLYGGQTEELKQHCQKLIDIYEEAAKENENMANMHH
jgi:hypothetical protein